MTTRPHDVAAAVAAAALAEGEWTGESVLARATEAVGRRAFLRPVVAGLLAAYAEPPRDRPREVAAAIRASPAFERAVVRASRTGRPMARVRVWFPVATPSLRLRSRALPQLATVGEVGAWLGLDDGALHGYADPRSWERTARDPRLRNYTYRWTPSSSGERLLERPRPRLRAVQRRVLDDLVVLIPIHEAAHGFVPGRSVRSFAAPHAGRRVVVRVDLRSFFSTVTAGRVWAALRTAGYPEQVAHVLTGLVTNAVPYSELRDHGTATQRQLLRRPHLPQGAPTSPALANLVAGRLDRRLAGLAAALGYRYTRYADDLAFSTDGGGAGPAAGRGRRGGGGGGLRRPSRQGLGPARGRPAAPRRTGGERAAPGRARPRSTGCGRCCTTPP